jgi:hypothetical protein
MNEICRLIAKHLHGNGTRILTTIKQRCGKGIHGQLRFVEKWEVSFSVGRRGEEKGMLFSAIIRYITRKGHE